MSEWVWGEFENRGGMQSPMVSNDIYEKAERLAREGRVLYLTQTADLSPVGLTTYGGLVAGDTDWYRIILRDSLENECTCAASVTFCSHVVAGMLVQRVREDEDAEYAYIERHR